MWREVVGGSLLFIGSVIAFLFFGREPPYLQFAIPMALLGVVVCVGRFRIKDVLVIEPNRLGIGRAGKPTVWSDRARIGFVGIKAIPMVAVWFYDPDGKLLHTHPFAHFDAKELRQALRDAGIPER